MTEEYHEFKKSQGKEQSRRPWFDAVYKSLGGTNIRECIYETKTGKKQQRDDIDVIVTFNGCDRKISEKTRERDWGDIYVEHYSVFESREPGWTVKSKADILAYSVEDRNVCKMCRMYMVQNAYKIVLEAIGEEELVKIETELITTNIRRKDIEVSVPGIEKKVKIPVIVAPNEEYHTTGFALPKKVLNKYVRIKEIAYTL